MSVGDRMQAQADLVAVQSKLRDWPSLLPSCLVIHHDQRRPSPVTSYNCEPPAPLARPRATHG